MYQCNPTEIATLEQNTSLNRMRTCAIFWILALPFFGWAQHFDTGALDTIALRTVDSLKQEFGANKVVPEAYEASFYWALSHYPELQHAPIEFKTAKIKTTLNARPTLGSLLFRRKSKRSYMIRINDTEKDSVVLLAAVPLKAQIGLFGHELGHFADYTTRSFWGVLGRMFAYTHLKGKERFEKEIDSLTIDRELGPELLAWSDYVLNHSAGSEAYKNYKRQVYLEPEEIQVILEERKQVKE